MGVLLNSPLKDPQAKSAFLKSQLIKQDKLSDAEREQLRALLGDDANDLLLQELEQTIPHTQEQMWFKHCQNPVGRKADLRKVIAACDLISDAMNNWFYSMPALRPNGYTTEDVQYTQRVKAEMETLRALCNCVYELPVKKGNKYKVYSRLLTGAVLFTLQRHNIKVSSHFASETPNVAVCVIELLLGSIASKVSRKQISEIIIDFWKNSDGTGLGAVFQSPS